MTAALIDLSAGLPEGAAFVSVREDAIWWASIATPIELLEVMTAALKQLGRRALHLEMRKRLFMTLWRSFTKDDQARFVDFARRVSP
ncbi:MAG: hypothetical protein JSS08_07710 [Proteobacteria bacterium]|nr:hypothetical protein [Pseudomonadota bacterium]